MGPTTQHGSALSTHLDGGTKPAAAPTECKVGQGWHSQAGAPAFKQVPSVGELERRRPMLSPAKVSL